MARFFEDEESSRPEHGLSRSFFPVAPIGFAIRPRSAGPEVDAASLQVVGSDRVPEFRRIGGRIVAHRACRQWQHAVTPREAHQHPISQEFPPEFWRPQPQG
jgi:hypothetical protein